MLGAIIGDTIGSIYEFNNVRRKDVELFDGDNFLTDDSIMTLAIGEIIQKRLYNDKNKIIETINAGEELIQIEDMDVDLTIG